jgi:hypothetical protein
MTRYFVLVCLWLVGCGGQPGSVAAALQSADGGAAPTLAFAADWSVTQSAPIVSGGQAVIHYDLARLPHCRAWYRGYPAWDIVAYWSTDGGPGASAPVTMLTADRQRVATDVAITVAPGHDLALWFHASDEGGCSEWDSDYGRDFHVALAPGLPTVHFRWPDFSDDVDGTLAAGAELVIDYDLRRLPWCRQDYNGHPTWDVTVGYRFDGGAAATASLTTTPSDYQRVQAPARITAPAGAHTMELWFENHDRTGCQRWDSAYGANYSFALQ